MRELFISAFISFNTFPVGQKFAYTQLVFGSIADTLFNLGLPQASHNKLSEFFPIPTDRAGVAESGLLCL